MIFVSVSVDGKVTEKRVLCGDDEKNFTATVEEQKANADKEYTVYREDEKATFEAIVVDRPETSNQKTWDTLKLKATDAEKFLASLLGLNG